MVSKLRLPPLYRNEIHFTLWNIIQYNNGFQRLLLFGLLLFRWILENFICSVSWKHDLPSVILWLHSDRNMITDISCGGEQCINLVMCCCRISSLDRPGHLPTLLVEFWSLSQLHKMYGKKFSRCYYEHNSTDNEAKPERFSFHLYLSECGYRYVEWPPKDQYSHFLMSYCAADKRKWVLKVDNEV